jgi:hypothetical protein
MPWGISSLLKCSVLAHVQEEGWVITAPKQNICCSNDPLKQGSYLGSLIGGVGWGDFVDKIFTNQNNNFR